MRFGQRRYKLTRKGRLAVTYGAVNEIQKGVVGATMTQVARYMLVKPSTYIMDCLKELETEGALYHTVSELKNGVVAKEWFVMPPDGQRLDKRNE